MRVVVEIDVSQSFIVASKLFSEILVLINMQ